MAIAKKIIKKETGTTPKKVPTLRNKSQKTVKKLEAPKGKAKSKIKSVKVTVYGMEADKKTETSLKPNIKSSSLTTAVRPVTAVANSRKNVDEKPVAKISPIIKPIETKDTKAEVFLEELEEKASGRSLGLYKKIFFSFVFLTLALLAVIFYFSFAKAYIYVTPDKEKIGNNLIVDVYDSEKIKNMPENGIAGVVNRVEISDTKSYPSSGIESIGGGVAGKVIIYNKYVKSQPLVATTRLLTLDNKLFRIKNTVNVPAGGSVEAEIYADSPTADMVVPATRFTIPGLWSGLQDKIYAESEETIKYEGQEKRFITQGDIDSGIADLKKQLIEKAQGEVSETYGDYDQVIYSIDENSLSAEVSGKLREEKDQFDVSLKTAVVIVAFKDERLMEMAKEKLLTVVPDDKDFSEFNKQDIAYTLTNSNFEQGTATIYASFEGTVALRESALQDDSIIDRNELIGLSREKIIDVLATVPGISNYEVRFSPSFITKAPGLVDRIVVKAKE